MPDPNSPGATSLRPAPRAQRAPTVGPSALPLCSGAGLDSMRKGAVGEQRARARKQRVATSGTACATVSSSVSCAAAWLPLPSRRVLTAPSTHHTLAQSPRGHNPTTHSNHSAGSSGRRTRAASQRGAGRTTLAPHATFPRHATDTGARAIWRRGSSRCHTHEWFSREGNRPPRVPSHVRRGAGAPGIDGTRAPAGRLPLLSIALFPSLNRLALQASARAQA